MASVQKTLRHWSLLHLEDKELLTLIVGRKGGKTTIKIIDKLLMKPHNKNQLAKILNVDYNTITHHIKIMHNHRYITEEKLDNVFYYLPSEKLFKSIEEYNIIREFILNNNLDE
ncbi:winged helix-turn-helix domain-containing protein [Methanobrevibacter sp.]|uniref:helix-turn-helix domain-containing protein n=1 Tax=Methanobrevibacter sp. TaxID=66852 RepID=UPI0038636419